MKPHLGSGDFTTMTKMIPPEIYNPILSFHDEDVEIQGGFDVGQVQMTLVR